MTKQIKEATGIELFQQLTNTNFMNEQLDVSVNYENSDSSISKQEAKERYFKARNEFVRLFYVLLEYKKAHSSGEMSEQEYREKETLIRQRQEVLGKEYFHMSDIAYS